jgi:radical SAM superfamily enzyme YgiQ (UPF0313 family)
MADILLTHGYFLADDEKERQIMKPYPPLGLLYLSAYLKRAGFSVEIFDSTFGERAALTAQFAANPGGVLGVYTNLMTRRSVLEIVRAAKRHDWTVVLGGPESANYISEYLGSGADVIVIGEGELTMTELLGALARHGPHRLHEVAGVAFRDEDGTIVRTGERAIDHGLYLDAWKKHHGASSINLITARGCPYRCNWCSHAVYGFTHRRRSPAQVADEVQWIVERYAPDQVWYADDVFTISHPWLANYTAELRRRGIHRPFETITRADRLQSAVAAAQLRELGCYRIWIGSESGSQRILDAMQRGVSVEQVRRACQLAKEHGIQVGMFLMWGYEGEELEDIAATVEHVKVTNPEIFFTTVSYPIKGTGYFEKVRDRVRSPIAWHEGSDRDYSIDGRRDREYYRLADQWLRSEVEAERLLALDPHRSAELLGAARRARELMRHWGTAG